MQELVGLFGDDVLLVGGAALRAHFGLNWRTTDDVDVYVAVRGAEAERRLTAAGWTVATDRELGHRWRSRAGCTVDVVPAGSPPGVRESQIAREGGPALNVVGSRAAFRDRRRLSLGDGGEMGVAGAAGLFVLKTSAYLDAPGVRPHDLQDIAWLLHHHADDGDRRFEDDVLTSGLPYESAGAYLLGRDVAALIDDVERARILAWLAFVEEPGRQRLSIMGRRAPGTQLHDDAAAWAGARLAAFRLGFSPGD